MSTNPPEPGKVRVTRLKIEKFRAIGSAEIELGDTVALVGQNGAGKSSALRALNAFFNFEEERQDFETGRHAYTKTSQAVIEITLVGLKGAGLPTTQTGGDEVRARLKFKKAPVWECLTGSRWQAAPTNLHDVLEKHISFALVPVRRDHEVAHDPSRGLLARAVEEWVTHNRQRDRLSPQVAKVGASLQTRSLAGLEKQRRKVAPPDGPFQFSLSYTVQPDYRLLLQNLEISVSEGGQPIPLSDSGSGTQSMAVFGLYAYLAELRSVTYMLGFEEPEQNLHPQAQKQLMRKLVELGLQVVFTTHSPTIVDALDHEHVVLCRRVVGKRRELEVELSQIGHAFFTVHGLDRDKYYKFHRRRNSEFLFADFVIVTESPIDAAVLSQVLTDAGEDIESLGVSVISLDGVESIDYMYYLLHGLGIESSYVVDKDYFLPYRAGDRASSLDPKSFPQYGPTPKSGTLLEIIFPKATAREAVAKQLTANHSAAMELLREVGFFCFRYSLEIDLVGAAGPRERLHDHLRVPLARRTTRELLVNNYKKIKSQEALLKAVTGLAAKGLPNSYKSLRRELPRMARAARTRP
ncbi:AAA family ATPase [Tessaracoccus sp. SD287]|uniref:ATP-dependent nuclease n=1 Tax=Tessaracoccus sp. SD287 TaxID=2782008 RepID=UPI001A95A042|nr:AAA family ATPase [Tessaracoccus sp. SD287]MBO1031393.1 AAA family ATPase [Tessaracoccus sp. SD287]